MNKLMSLQPCLIKKKNPKPSLPDILSWTSKTSLQTETDCAPGLPPVICIVVQNEFVWQKWIQEMWGNTFVIPDQTAIHRICFWTNKPRCNVLCRATHSATSDENVIGRCYGHMIAYASQWVFRCRPQRSPAAAVALHIVTLVIKLLHFTFSQSYPCQKHYVKTRVGTHVSKCHFATI